MFRNIILFHLEMIDIIISTLNFLSILISTLQWEFDYIWVVLTILP